ncbi:MAG: glycosyltransferase family 4 protein [Pedobacter sp.]
MKVNFVLPSVSSRQSGSAGTLIVYEYANRFAKKGHEVSIVPLKFEGMPQVEARIEYNDKNIVKFKLKNYTTRAINKITKANRKITLDSFLSDRFDEVSNAISNMPECDVNIATAYQTALPVYLSAKGLPFYFIQHFEEYFTMDSPFSDVSLMDASLTYNLPMYKITNSSWVSREILSKYPNQQITGMVNNALDTNLFYPRKTGKNERIRVLTHSGRKKEWKGFIDAVNAMKLLRSKYPNVDWWVFGDEGLVPPVNDIASYNSYGFVKHTDLPEIYSTADILLCPSWYESFPMPPIEAMACGTAVITTPFGAEDYTEDGQNCLIVPPRNPNKMAEAVIRLIENEELRNKLAEEGIKTARRFTWERSVNQFEEILKKTLGTK